MSLTRPSRHSRRGISAIALACVATLLIAPSASADCHSVAQADWQGGFTLVCDGDSSGSSGTSRPHRVAPKVATEKQRRTLRFRPSASAAQRARTDLAGDLADTGDADLDADIRAYVGQSSFTAPVLAAMRKNGFSTRNLGDYYAWAYLTGWSVTHGFAPIRARVVTAVRQDLRNRLALRKQVRRLSADRKAAYAEHLAGWISQLAGSAAYARSNGDAAEQRNAIYVLEHRLFDDDLLGADVGDARIGRKGVTADSFNVIRWRPPVI